VVRRFLPAGWVGGLTFGVGLLLVLGPAQDPLRAENPDFDLVGPGWLAVLVFTALALVYGFVLAAFVARLSAWLPLPSADPGVLLRYAPITVVAVIGAAGTSMLVGIGLVAVIVTRWPPLVRWVQSPSYVVIGRVALVAVVAISLSTALHSATDIASRG
jgi:hypothetical protein